MKHNQLIEEDKNRKCPNHEKIVSSKYRVYDSANADHEEYRINLEQCVQGID